MCRNIRPLNNFEPPATRDEVTAAALQYVRKVAGTTKPSQANEEVFYAAVKEIAHITEHLLDDLVTAAPPKNPFRRIVAAIVASAIAVPIQGTERPSRRDIRMPPHRAIRCPMLMPGSSASCIPFR